MSLPGWPRLRLRLADSAAPPAAPPGPAGPPGGPGPDGHVPTQSFRLAGVRLAALSLRLGR